MWKTDCQSGSGYWQKMGSLSGYVCICNSAMIVTYNFSQFIAQVNFRVISSSLYSDDHNFSASNAMSCTCPSNVIAQRSSVNSEKKRTICKSNVQHLKNYEKWNLSSEMTAIKKLNPQKCTQALPAIRSMMKWK